MNRKEGILVNIFEKNGIVYELDMMNKIGIVKYSDSKIQEAKILPNVNGCTIVEIATRAFYHCENLKKVFLPDTIKKIKNEAFCGSYKLEKINNNNQLLVENIGFKAFKDCKKLKGLKLESLKTLGKSVFENCECLLFVILSNKLEVLEENTFLNCSSLQNITLTKSIRIVKNAFVGCENLKQITFLNDYLDMMPFIASINKNVMLIGREGSEAQKMLMYGYYFQLLK